MFRRRLLPAVVAATTLWAAAHATAQQSNSRTLAPGVLKVIPPAAQPSETFIGPLSLVEVTKGLDNLDWTPNYLAQTETLLAMSQNVIMRHEVWSFEFSFKPLRFMMIDVPQPNGRMQPKLVWYLVYRVRYLGNDLKPEPVQDALGDVTYPTTTSDSKKSRRFFPHFVLESLEYEKSYLDQIIPAAKRAIESRERIGQPLYNSVEITQVPVPLSQEDGEGVWGYATWTDIDPRIDFFSVYVQGLTNAYQFEDKPDEFQPGDPPGTGRSYALKTLRLNFWRPGDSILQHEGEIRYGVPIELDAEKRADILRRYGLSERVDHLWVYR